MFHRPREIDTVRTPESFAERQHVEPTLLKFFTPTSRNADLTYSFRRPHATIPPLSIADPETSLPNRILSSLILPSRILPSRGELPNAELGAAPNRDSSTMKETKPRQQRKSLERRKRKLKEERYRKLPFVKKK